MCSLKRCIRCMSKCTIDPKPGSLSRSALESFRHTVSISRASHKHSIRFKLGVRHRCHVAEANAGQSQRLRNTQTCTLHKQATQGACFTLNIRYVTHRPGNPNASTQEKKVCSDSLMPSLCAWIAWRIPSIPEAAGVGPTCRAGKLYLHITTQTGLFT